MPCVHPAKAEKGGNCLFCLLPATPEDFLPVDVWRAVYLQKGRRKERKERNRKEATVLFCY